MNSSLAGYPKQAESEETPAGAYGYVQYNDNPNNPNNPNNPKKQ